MQELVADAPVGADRRRHLLHIGADRLAQIGDLVDEADLHGEEGVGGIFGELGRFPAHEHHRRVAQGERLVQALHEVLRPVVVAADQHAVGMREIVDGRALAQELRIGADREIGVGPEPLEPPLDLAAGADRHRRFGADDGEALEMRSKLLDRLKHEAQIGMAVAAPHRRADREEHEVGTADRGCEIGREC